MKTPVQSAARSDYRATRLSCRPHWTVILLNCNDTFDVRVVDTRSLVLSEDVQRTIQIGTRCGYAAKRGSRFSAECLLPVAVEARAGQRLTEIFGFRSCKAQSLSLERWAQRVGARFAIADTYS